MLPVMPHPPSATVLAVGDVHGHWRAEDATFLDSLGGQVVKVVAPLLSSLPAHLEYRVIFMERDLDEVLASQRTMLEWREGAVPLQDSAALRRAFASQLEKVKRWLAEQPRIRVCVVSHREALSSSLAQEVPEGIVVVALNPGIIATDMLADAFEGDVSAYPTPESLGPAWLRLFERLDASANGQSLDL